MGVLKIKTGENQWEEIKDIKLNNLISNTISGSTITGFNDISSTNISSTNISNTNSIISNTITANTSLNTPAITSTNGTITNLTAKNFTSIKSTDSSKSVKVEDGSLLIDGKDLSVYLSTNVSSCKVGTAAPSGTANNGDLYKIGRAHV